MRPIPRPADSIALLAAHSTPERYCGLWQDLGEIDDVDGEAVGTPCR
jgi:hypothetical protein